MGYGEPGRSVANPVHYSSPVRRRQRPKVIVACQNLEMARIPRQRARIPWHLARITRQRARIPRHFGIEFESCMYFDAGTYSRQCHRSRGTRIPMKHEFRSGTHLEATRILRERHSSRNNPNLEVMHGSRDAQISKKKVQILRRWRATRGTRWHAAQGAQRRGGGQVGVPRGGTPLAQPYV